MLTPVTCYSYLGKEIKRKNPATTTTGAANLSHSLNFKAVTNS
jgi:hypothetical protein